MVGQHDGVLEGKQAAVTTGAIDFTKPFDTSSIKGKSALVTGGASGLGAGYVKGLAEAGAYVTIVDLNEKLGEEYADELQKAGLQFVFLYGKLRNLTDSGSVTFVKADVTDWESQVSAFKTAIKFAPHKAIDIVIPNAALAGAPIVTPNEPEPSLDTDPAAPHLATLTVNLIGVFMTTKLALHYFGLKGEGASDVQSKKQIIFICSIAGYKDCMPLISDYEASKFGVRGLWKSIRANVAPRGVRTNLIAPTMVDTPMTHALVPFFDAAGLKMAPLGSAVDAVLRLAGDESIDGRAILVGASGNLDILDDDDNYDGGVEMLNYFRSGALGEGPTSDKTKRVLEESYKSS
ncbi:MAG: hypothetical protein M1827_003926 [Pycnora praestabilis]|nr:MAG: hypothetical protein M1827_003926 [Pycnora praestabilis]